MAWIHSEIDKVVAKPKISEVDSSPVAFDVDEANDSASLPLDVDEATLDLDEAVGARPTTIPDTDLAFKAIASIQGLWRGHQQRKSLKVSNLRATSIATTRTAKTRAIYAACRRYAQTKKPTTLREHALNVMRAVREVSWTSGFIDNMNYHALWGSMWALICKAWACEPDDIRVFLVLEKQLMDLRNIFPKKKECAKPLQEMKDKIDTMLLLCTRSKEAYHEARRVQYQEFVTLLEKELGEVAHQLPCVKADPVREAEKMQAKLEALLGLATDAMDLHSTGEYFDKKKFKGLKKHLEDILLHMSMMDFDEMEPTAAEKALAKIQQKAGNAFDKLFAPTAKRKVTQFNPDSAGKTKQVAADACDELHGNLKSLFQGMPKADKVCKARSSCVLERLGMWDPMGLLATPEFISFDEEEVEEEESEVPPSPVFRKTITKRPTIRQSLANFTKVLTSPAYEESAWDSEDLRISKLEGLQEEEEETETLEQLEGIAEDDIVATPDIEVEDENDGLEEDSALILIEDDTSGAAAYTEGLDEGAGEEFPETRPSAALDEFADDDAETGANEEPSPKGRCAWIENGWMPLDSKDSRSNRWRHQSLIWQSRQSQEDGDGRSSTLRSASKTGRTFPRSYNRGGIPGFEGSPTLNLDLDLDNNRKVRVHGGTKDLCDPSGAATGPKMLRESRSAGGLPHPSKAKGLHSRLFAQDSAATPSVFVEKLCGPRLIPGRNAARLMLSRTLSESQERPTNPSGISLHVRARIDVILGDDVGRFSSWHSQIEHRRSSQAVLGMDAIKDLSTRHRSLVGDSGWSLPRKRALLN